MLKNDIEEIVKKIENTDQYKNKTFLITGGTGFLGSLIVRTLFLLNKKYKLNLKILFYIRNEEKLKNLFNEELKNTNYDIIVGNLSSEIKYENKIDYIFHCANTTNSLEMIKKPVETISSIFEGTKYILELAKEKKIESMVYLSSMEVYGQVMTDILITEKELGNIDILNTRSSYSEGKRAAECLCKCYSSEYNVPIKIARLAQIFGPGVSKDDNRVFAQFIRSALKKEDIVLHTTGESKGNYCYTVDCIRALFLLLNKGENGEAYNVVNEETNISIKEMAYLVANEIFPYKINVKIEIPKEDKGYAPITKLRLSGEKLRKLNWQPERNLKEMYLYLKEYLLNNRKDKN